MKSFVARILTTVAVVLLPIGIAAIKHYGTWVFLRDDKLSADQEGPRPKIRRQWVLLLVAGTATGVFWYLMQIDQLHGGHQTWPVYAFAGAFMFYGVVWISVMIRWWPFDGAA